MGVIDSNLNQKVSGAGFFLGEAIRAATEAVNKAGNLNRDLRGMATTVVLALAEEKKLPIASVGDSRTYLIRNNAIEQVVDKVRKSIVKVRG